jgi:hypothetical protein
LSVVTAKPRVARELDRDGTGLEAGDTRAEIMLREFIFFLSSQGKP